MLLHRYNGPWKVLREPDTASRYCGTAISFVSFCLRARNVAVDKIPVRFTDTQKTMLADYEQYLMTVWTPSDNDIELFQQVLCCVLFRDRQLDIDPLGKLACPVQSFIGLLALRSVGQFVKAGLVTQPISRLLYVSRCSALLLALSKASGADNKRFIR